MSSLVELYTKAREFEKEQKRTLTRDEKIQQWFELFCSSLVMEPYLWSAEIAEMKQMALAGRSHYDFDLSTLLVKHPFPKDITTRDVITFLFVEEYKFLQRIVDQPNSLLYNSKIVLGPVKSVSYNAFGYITTGFQIYITFDDNTVEKGWCIII